MFDSCIQMKPATLQKVESNHKGILATIAWFYFGFALWWLSLFSMECAQLNSC